MVFLAYLILPFLLCATMTGIAVLLWWKALSNPAAFAVAAFLSTLGLHRVLQIRAELVKLFWGSYFLVARKSLDIVQLAKESINTETVVLCLMLVAFGIPLLYWLRATMLKA